MKTIKIPKSIRTALLSQNINDFPIYTTFLINQASQTAQATRPKIVGQLSDEYPLFIEECDRLHQKPTLNLWKKYHSKKFPDAKRDAFAKIKTMLNNFKVAFDKIDDQLITIWLEDLLYEKTFYGFNVESLVRHYLSEKGFNIRKATAEEESKNIDLFIDDRPYQIKPTSINQKQSIKEKIEIPIILYEEKDDQVSILVGDDDSTFQKLP